MAKIFVSGGSGLGKSSFCHNIANLYKIKFIEESARKRFSSPDFAALNWTLQELIFAFDYIKIHNCKKQAIVDRSILDVFAWTYGWLPAVHHLNPTFLKKPALQIIIPIPSLEFYKKNIDRWIVDPVRYQTWSSKAGIDTIKDPMEIAEVIRNNELEFERNLVYMCNVLEWTYFIPEVNRDDVDNFIPSWHEVAKKEVEKVYKLEAK